MSGFLKQIFATIIVNLGVLSLGILLSYSSPSIPSMENDSKFQNITSQEKAFVASLAHIGSLFACPITGLTMKYWGRKISIFIFAILLILSWVLLGVANNLWVIYMGRFLTGIFAGTYKIIAPLYIGEISDKEHRGFLSGFYEVFINFGVLFIYISGLFFNWSQLAFLSAIFPFILVFAILPIPDSPIYFIEKGRFDEAIKSQAWFKGKSPLDPEIIKEINSIEKKKMCESNDPVTYRVIFTQKEYLIPLTITIWLNILEQFTGYSAFIFYSINIFMLAGVSLDNSGIYTIIVGIVQLFGTILSSLLSDRVGRKSLLISSLFLMSLPLIVLGFYFVLPSDIFPHWVPLICMILFVFFMSIGIAPVSSTIPGEILPIKIREFGASLSIGISRATGFLVTFGFEAIQNQIGIYFCFWIFAAFCLIGVLTVYLFIPETKGKSLAQIQDMFNSKRKNFK